MNIDEILKKFDKDKCPKCKQQVSQGDIAWNNGNTEYGTPYCSVFCFCPKCDIEIFYIQSWYPHVDDNEDLAYVLESELE